jgi:hypothetical protein
MGNSLGFEEVDVNFLPQGGKLLSGVAFFPEIVMSIMKHQDTMDASCVFVCFFLGVGFKCKFFLLFWEGGG